MIDLSFCTRSVVVRLGRPSNPVPCVCKEVECRASHRDGIHTIRQVVDITRRGLMQQDHGVITIRSYYNYTRGRYNSLGQGGSPLLPAVPGHWLRRPTNHFHNLTPHSVSPLPIDAYQNKQSTIPFLVHKYQIHAHCDPGNNRRNLKSPLFVRNHLRDNLGTFENCVCLLWHRPWQRWQCRRNGLQSQAIGIMECVKVG